MMRKILLITILLTVMLHAPAFKAAINILVQLHIFTRIVFDNTCHLGSVYLPAVADVFVELCPQVQELLGTQYHRLTHALAPTVRWLVLFFTQCVVLWLRKSPGYLCAINKGIINVASSTISWAIGSEESLAALQDWCEVKFEALNLCKTSIASL
jgi:hypothetical protein